MLVTTALLLLLGIWLVAFLLDRGSDKKMWEMWERELNEARIDPQSPEMSAEKSQTKNG
ncbi:hypothetical protein AWB76_04900 [Caballeronia temeraria]|uniref:Uncharacterized protein n=1 Tax=Caballeronia temeraria TaxID=1777137 RepID=A0A158BZ57_9BURK|nr:hypothetical protein [Caballeronia temeraria]SAK75394.1 hypothetical protein AWB76_04900 [Caballeronia temeraria]